MREYFTRYKGVYLNEAFWFSLVFNGRSEFQGWDIPILLFRAPGERYMIYGLSEKIAIPTKKILDKSNCQRHADELVDILNRGLESLPPGKKFRSIDKLFVEVVKKSFSKKG